MNWIEEFDNADKWLQKAQNCFKYVGCPNSIEHSVTADYKSLTISEKNELLDEYVRAVVCTFDGPIYDPLSEWL